MAIRQRIFAGVQLRALRERHQLMQAELAEKLAISPSYLSQLEHDDRPLTPRLIERVTRLFPLEWQDFPGDDAEQLSLLLREALGDPIFDAPLAPEAIARLAQQQPAFARRFVELHSALRRANQRLEMVDETLALDAPEDARLPWEEVRDWFHLSNNYVDRIDRAAERLAAQVAASGSGADDVPTTDGLLRHLTQQHGITVELLPAISLRSFDAVQRVLRIDSGQPAASMRFQLAYHVASTALGEAIREIVANARLRSPVARELLAVGLGNYAAGAVLMPYGHFRRSARAFRHDVDRLALAYQTSFEQTCHRLSTMQREGERGLPIFFCRVDMAGNITKRHSATRFQFARFGGACPLWIVHEAAAIPDRIAVQLAETPDGERYVSIAKGLVKPSGRFDRNPRRYAVALGCEVKHAGEFVYADGLDLASPRAVTPIGVSCRICPRPDCEQRAYPPNDQQIAVHHWHRRVVPYELTE
ncbi:helix-turn-helix domain-containing protein [Porphyrobacter sp. AAP60]|uniref:helix-turn-helix domain-containing protein n=1 Tax=Porphyrobacter sp. AAP60 TaxID=1523423 RepID=UPI0006B952B0|nr:helix-turn-helix transcriptional regulator [Porphyrobacter sp. AAP60]KPF64309.1 XRE family transcriptional regulator [Porphyrobacter sp. AAP60]